MRIAELQRWVCAEAGEDGWIKFNQTASGPKVAVIGGGPSALCCAYYLTLAGYKVTIFAQEDHPGGALWEKAGSDQLLKSAVQNDIRGVMSTGIAYEGGQQLGVNLDLNNILESFQAVYLADADLEGNLEIYNAWLGAYWKDYIDRENGQVSHFPQVFIREEFTINRVSVAEAVAFGRNAACSIDRFLSSQA